MSEPMSETATLARPPVSQPATHVDVLIVGAGISGVGGAWHLQQHARGRRFAVLESQDELRRHLADPQVPRHPLGLATCIPSATASSPGPAPRSRRPRRSAATWARSSPRPASTAHIRYNHRIASAAWSSEHQIWTVTATRGDTGEAVRFTANFLWMCQGYYRHEKGYTPEWPGMENFQGQLIHPQDWPEDLDYSGKRVVVIGSGATAATVVPAMAAKAAHVTMLQRTPTYFRTGRNAIAIADELRSLSIDETWIHEIVRRTILLRPGRLHPPHLRGARRSSARRLLANVQTYRRQGLRPVDPHFTPGYRPWRQRLAFVPDGDLFQEVAKGRPRVVTDEIEGFTEGGIQLKSGQHLEADIIVTATGFNLNVLGDIAFEIDGQPLDFGSTVTYRGMMFTGVPNMVWVFGYFRASWTLRADLVGDFVCRLLRHMDAIGARAGRRPRCGPRTQACRCCPGSTRRTSTRAT